MAGRSRTRPKLHVEAPASPLMTIPEVAVYLRAAPSWVRHLIAAAILPYQRQGKSYLVLRRDVDAYIEACREPCGKPNIVKTTVEVAERKGA